MEKRTARSLFIWGTVICAAVFIWFTIHTPTTIPKRTKTDKLTDEVIHRISKSGVDSYILKSENLSLRFSFGLSWIPAGVYPDENRGRNDKATSMLSFPCLCAEALQRAGVEMGIQSKEISNIFG